MSKKIWISFDDPLQGQLGGGYLIGKVDDQGELTGPDIAYIYPDFRWFSAQRKPVFQTRSSDLQDGNPRGIHRREDGFWKTVSSYIFTPGGKSKLFPDLEMMSECPGGWCGDPNVQ